MTEDPFRNDKNADVCMSDSDSDQNELKSAQNYLIYGKSDQLIKAQIYLEALGENFSSKKSLEICLKNIGLNSDDLGDLE